MLIPQKKFAEVSTLASIFSIEIEAATLIRELVLYKVNPDDYPVNISDKDYSYLDRQEKILWVIDKIIGGFGVEALVQNQNDQRNIYSVPYVNMGETYQTTILFHQGRFKVMSWGDLVERYNLE